MVTSGVEKPPAGVSWRVGAPVLRNVSLASNIVSPRKFPLSVGLVTGPQSGSWALGAAQMISNCWSTI